MENINFAKRTSIEFVEEGQTLAPKFNDEGILPVVVTESESGAVLMIGFMNKNALEKTIQTKEAHYWSRSRQTLWKKGESSGMVHKVDEILIDDDQDSVWLSVDIGDGASCHVGYRSCFYRSVPMGPIENGRKVEMEFLEKEKKFDPEEVYKGQPNPTKI